MNTSSVVISLANQKGGVAKTTSCVNIGAGLALRGYKTLLIDFDPQANLSQFLGVPINNGSKIITSGDWVMGRARAQDAIQETTYPNLHIASSSESLKGYEMDMQKDMFKMFKYLQKCVNEVREEYNFILIDTLPSFSLLFVNSIAACDYVLIPAKLEYLSMQGLNLLQEKIQDVRENIKPVEVLGIFGAFFRKGVSESEKCLQELQRSLSELSMKSVIHLNSKLAESASHAKPIQHYDKSSQGFEDYENLVEEVLERCQVKP